MSSNECGTPRGRPRKQSGPRAGASRSKARALFWKNSVRREIVRTVGDGPTIRLSDAQFETIWTNYPWHASTKEEAKHAIEVSLTSALIFPQIYDKLRLRELDYEQLKKAKIHCDALLSIFASEQPLQFFLSECAEKLEVNYSNIARSLKRASTVLELARDFFPRGSSQHMSEMQRRFLVKELETSWWIATGLEATRSQKEGSFGDALLRLLEVLSEFNDQFSFLGDLRSKHTRTEVAKRMVSGIDLTKARGPF
jgi:hypothetical protein